MATTFALLGVFILCLLLMISIFTRGRKGGSPVSKTARHAFLPRLSDSPDSTPSDRDSSQFGHYNESARDSHPFPDNIRYSPVPEGRSPLSPDAIETGVRKSIEERIAALQPIPAGSIRLLNLLKDPSSNSGEVTALVSTNPVFSAKVLRSVNSGYFNLPQKVTSVGRAITLLGYNNVRSLVLQDAVQRMIPQDRSIAPQEYHKIWVHSAIVSVCSGYLGKRHFGLSEYDLATMGLLHDIGKYFVHTLGKGGKAKNDESLPLILNEEACYGVSHAIVGSFVMERWGLSDLFSSAVAYHHHPSFLPLSAIPVEYSKHSFILCLSDLLGKIMEQEEDAREILPIRDEYYEAFGLAPDPTELIMPSLVKEVEKTRATIESYVHATHTRSEPV